MATIETLFKSGGFLEYAEQANTLLSWQDNGYVSSNTPLAANTLAAIQTTGCRELAEIRLIFKQQTEPTYLDESTADQLPTA